MKKAPAIFIGHGSPMNVIEDNIFNDFIKTLSKKLEIENIKAIICISAHYQTQGIQINASENPKIIHDFSGFPDILYSMQYKAPGSPVLAEKLKNLFKKYNPKVTTDWGFDHGAWNILWHLFPKANIPVVMLSLDYNLNFNEHYELGILLQQLRKEGVLILGSGNVVHSFKGIQFSKDAIANQHALNFEKYVATKIKNRQHNDLIIFESSISESAKFSVNSAEHYLPLLYVLGASFDDEKETIFNDQIVFSTLSMLSVGFGI